MKHDSRSSTLRRSIQAIGSWQPNSNDALKWHSRRLSKHERRWNAWLRILRSPPLTAEMKAHLQDLGRHLPELWASGRLTPAQQKEVLRSLIRRVILTRPTPDTIEARVVWVSGATTSFSVHPPILRGADVSGYEQPVERILALGAQGYQDPEIARQVTAEGFRSARSARIPASLVGEIRRARGQIAPLRAVQDPSQGRGTMDRVWVSGGNWRCIETGCTPGYTKERCPRRATVSQGTT